MSARAVRQLAKSLVAARAVELRRLEVECAQIGIRAPVRVGVAFSRSQQLRTKTSTARALMHPKQRDVQPAAPQITSDATPQSLSFIAHRKHHSLPSRMLSNGAVMRVQSILERSAQLGPRVLSDNAQRLHSRQRRTGEEQNTSR